MKKADIILDYAFEHSETIVHKVFMRWYAEAYPNGSMHSMEITMQRMVASGTLVKTGYGVLQLGKNVKPSYRPIVNDKIRELFVKVHERYPYTRCCIWQASELGSFMQHVPNLDVIILEIEKLTAEAVFEDVRGMVDDRKMLLNPSERDYRLYASGEKSLIVKDMVSESPVQTVDGITVPMLEKILVDATVSPELDFARGGEMYTLFENAGEMYRIGRKTMLRYAARRGKREEIEKLINTTMP